MFAFSSCVPAQVSHVVVSTLDTLWLAPKGLRDVHNMLRNVARSLVAGGQTGVFSPMHMLVFQKPAETADA
jgi:24-methylenesterol C-methyltransferase